MRTRAPGGRSASRLANVAAVTRASSTATISSLKVRPARQAGERGTTLRTTVRSACSVRPLQAGAPEQRRERELGGAAHVAIEEAAQGPAGDRGGGGAHVGVGDRPPGAAEL